MRRAKFIDIQKIGRFEYYSPIMRRALPIFISVILVLAIVYFKLRKMENLE
jgi:hypothetical protein